jgi:hypothetical protein
MAGNLITNYSGRIPQISPAKCSKLLQNFLTEAILSYWNEHRNMILNDIGKCINDDRSCIKLSAAKKLLHPYFLQS